MSPANLDNIDRWLRQSDVDYFTHFVKAWIPFNAWYRNVYGSDDSERSILNEVKSDGNRIRTRFIANVEGADPDAEELRNHIALLHRRLLSDPLTNRDERISFERVNIGANPKSAHTSRYGGWTFTARRVDGPPSMACEVTDRKGLITAITHPGKWDERKVEGLPEYLALNVDRRARLLACYREVHPIEYRSLLAEANVRDPLLMDTYRFVREPDVVFAGVVAVLYALRNLLFHGELVPDPPTNRTYEPAYRILRGLISSIA
jgi:hypothetical protein